MVILAFFLVASLGLSGIVGERIYKNGFRTAIDRILHRGREMLWYDRMSSWLLRNGATYHFGQWIDPIWFLVLQILVTAAGFVAGNLLGPHIGLLAGCAMFALIPSLVLVMNRSDNLKMLPELKYMYHALEIQTRAGVYVTDSLAEIYGGVQEKRLKEALLELAGDLVMRADLGEALEKFRSKFDNRYIDSLCIIILQSLESGQSVDLLGDLSEQIKDMETAVMGRKKDALDRSVTFYQLGILVAVMGLVLYVCVSQMFSSAVLF